jgi:hypothetical protein
MADNDNIAHTVTLCDMVFLIERDVMMLGEKMVTEEDADEFASLLSTPRFDEKTLNEIHRLALKDRSTDVNADFIAPPPWWAMYLRFASNIKDFLRSEDENRRADLKRYVIDPFLRLRHNTWPTFQERSEVFLVQWSVAKRFIQEKLVKASALKITGHQLEVELVAWVRRQTRGWGNSWLAGSWRRLYLSPNKDQTLVELSSRRLTDFMRAYGMIGVAKGALVYYPCRIVGDVE